jgi:phage terminase small subunit
MGRRPIFRTPEQEIQVQYKYSNRDPRGIYHTYTGHKISAKQELFIQNIVKGLSPAEAYRQAGYTDSAGEGAKMLKNPVIAEEVEHRFDLARDDSIATAREIMQYYTRVMRGEEKDQFGLDAPLGERTGAAKELMKRVIEQEEQAQLNAAPEVKITLSFDRNGEE